MISLTNVNNKLIGQSVYIECDVICSDRNLKIPSKLWFEVEHIEIGPLDTYCPFVACIIPIAIVENHDIVVQGSIDFDFFKNCEEIIALFNSYYKNCHMINISCQSFSTSYSTNNKVATFYSGGVDSIFNISSHHIYKNNRITDAILVQGMDIPLENRGLFNEVKTKTEPILIKYRINLITVRTNARDFQNRKVDWANLGFGPILGGIAKIFKKEIRKVIIGSYGRYHELGPHSSGPLVDRLWSSSDQQVIHHSPIYDRLRKLSIINQNTNELLRELRVCWRNFDNKYNCGHCEKCLRTKMELRISGIDHNVASFGNYNIERDIWSLLNKIPDDLYTLFFWLNIYKKEKKIIIKISILISLLISYVKKYCGYYCAKRKMKKFILMYCCKS